MVTILICKTAGMVAVLAKLRVRLRIRLPFRISTNTLCFLHRNRRLARARGSFRENGESAPKKAPASRASHLPMQQDAILEPIWPISDDKQQQAGNPANTAAVNPHQGAAMPPGGPFRDGRRVVHQKRGGPRLSEQRKARPLRSGSCCSSCYFGFHR